MHESIQVFRYCSSLLPRFLHRPLLSKLEYRQRDKRSMLIRSHLRWDRQHEESAAVCRQPCKAAYRYKITTIPFALSPFSPSVSWLNQLNPGPLQNLRFPLSTKRLICGKDPLLLLWYSQTPETKWIATRSRPSLNKVTSSPSTLENEQKVSASACILFHNGKKSKTAVYTS